jgi:hypothetical protein
MKIVPAVHFCSILKISMKFLSAILTSVGHMAECPDGVDIGSRPSGSRNDPFSLCPTDPESAAFV